MGPHQLQFLCSGRTGVGTRCLTINNSDGNKLMGAWSLGRSNAYECGWYHHKNKGYRQSFFQNRPSGFIYDDVRLLGDLDWLQQGRRHDVLLVKASIMAGGIDLGAGFNQNTDAFGYTELAISQATFPPYVTNSLGALAATTRQDYYPVCPMEQLVLPAAKQAPRVLANTERHQWHEPAIQKLSNAVYKPKASLAMVKFAGLFFKDDFGKIPARFYGQWC